MINLLREFRSFVRRDCGVTAIEYALLASLLAMAITVGAALTGTNLGNLFSSLGDTVSDPVASAGKSNG